MSHGIVQTRPGSGGYRYRLLQPFRYPLGQLNPAGDDSASFLVRHADAYNEVVEQRQAHVLGPNEIEAVDHLTAEFGNIRAAVRHDLANGRELRAARTIASLHMYCFLRMSYEIYDWAEEALAFPDLDAELRAELLSIVALGAFNRGAIPESAALAEQAIALEGDRSNGPIHARVVMMSARGIDGDFLQANEHLNAALRWCDEREQSCYRMNVLVIASMGMTTQGGYDVAKGLAEHALSIAEDIANPSAVAWALAARADARRVDEPHAATLELQSAIEIARSASSRWVEGQALLNLARAARAAGDLLQAAEACSSALAHCQQHANLVQSRQGLREAFLLLVELGRPEDAVRLRPVLVPDLGTLPPSPDETRAMEAAQATLADSPTSPDPFVGRVGRPERLGEREALSVARTAIQSCLSSGRS